MGKRIANILRGVGSVLDIAPNPNRKISEPLYRHSGEPPERAIYRTWVHVGNSLIIAAGMNPIGETEEPQRRPSSPGEHSRGGAGSMTGNSS